MKKNKISFYALNYVSFLWSISSLMIFSILPAFLIEELGIGHMNIGIIEGIAIFFAFFSKFLAGVLSDLLKDRRILILIGTFFTILLKPIFIIVTSPVGLFIARSTERISKGVRSTPADALVGDLTKKNKFGSNYGLRQAFYTFGAVVGSIISMWLMSKTNGDYRYIFILSIFPVILSFVIMIFFLSNPKINEETIVVKYKKMTLKDKRKRKKEGIIYVLLLCFSFFLMLARFSEAFITLHAKEMGWTIVFLPLIIIIMDTIHAITAYPIGKLSDKWNKKKILFIGIIVMILANITLMYSINIENIILGIILIGFHMGISQGIIKSLIAYYSNSKYRGSAFSLFYLISGSALFLGNIIAGFISDLFGLWCIFYTGSLFLCVCLFFLFLIILIDQEII